MDRQKLDEIFGKLTIQDAVEHIVDDAYGVWGRLTEDKIQLLTGALHSRYGISREEAHEHVVRIAILNKFRNR